MEEEGKGPADVTPEVLDRAANLQTSRSAKLNADAIAKALDPMDCVENRWVTGSARPQEMEHQIDGSQDRLASDRSRLVERRRKLEEAEQKLSEAVGAITGLIGS